MWKLPITISILKRKDGAPINTKITKHINDIIQKYASNLFCNATLEFYGIKSAPTKEHNP